MIKTNENTINVDGKDVVFSEGQTVYEVATQMDKDIPTLCHEDRLDPTGACRMCLVDIEGWPRLAPSCATKATPGMTIKTNNERVERHINTLLSLYMSDHPNCEHSGESDIHKYAKKYGVENTWPQLEQVRADRSSDINPFIHFDSDKCILCARCTRYCDEVEAVNAITLSERGSKTTIATAFEQSLMDSSCELCGGCIDTCPTGAMSEKMPLEAGYKPDQEFEKVRTTCNYCGVGCQMDLQVDKNGNDGLGKVVKVTSPEVGSTTNDGNLCVKGRFAYEFIEHKERLKTPLIRKNGELVEASWDEALSYAAKGLLDVKNKYGADSLGFISSSRCTGEENYLVQKLSRAVFRTNNVHQCAAT